MHGGHGARNVGEYRSIVRVAAARQDRLLVREDILRQASHELDERWTRHRVEADEHLTVAADPAGVRLDDAEGERDRHRGIHHVATLAKNLQPGRRRDGVRAGHGGASGRRLAERGTR